MALRAGVPGLHVGALGSDPQNCLILQGVVLPSVPLALPGVVLKQNKSLSFDENLIPFGCFVLFSKYGFGKLYCLSADVWAPCGNLHPKPPSQLLT